MSVSLSTVGRTAKRRFVEGNLERALSEEPRPGAERKLTGKEEALLVATACAEPPAGRKRCDADAAGRHDGQAHRSQQPVGRDRASPAGRERPQAMAQGHVVHSKGRRRIRCPHGGRARPLRRDAESPPGRWSASTETPVQLIGEVRQPVPAQPGAARALRLRRSPKRHRQSLRHLRSTSGLAQRQDHRPPRRRGLRPLHA